MDILGSHNSRLYSIILCPRKMIDYDKWWHERKFRVTLSNLKSCNDTLGEVANEEEMEARRELIALCYEIGKLKPR